MRKKVLCEYYHRTSVPVPVCQGNFFIGNRLSSLLATYQKKHLPKEVLLYSYTRAHAPPALVHPKWERRNRIQIHRVGELRNPEPAQYWLQVPIRVPDLVRMVVARHYNQLRPDLGRPTLELHQEWVDVRPDLEVMDKHRMLHIEVLQDHHLLPSVPIHHLLHILR